jgi:hypothetical protein
LPAGAQGYRRAPASGAPGPGSTREPFQTRLKREGPTVFDRRPLSQHSRRMCPRATPVAQGLPHPRCPVLRYPCSRGRVGASGPARSKSPPGCTWGSPPRVPALRYRRTDRPGPCRAMNFHRVEIPAGAPVAATHPPVPCVPVSRPPPLPSPDQRPLSQDYRRGQLPVRVCPRPRGPSVPVLTVIPTEAPPADSGLTNPGPVTHQSPSGRVRDHIIGRALVRDESAGGGPARTGPEI